MSEDQCFSNVLVVVNCINGVKKLITLLINYSFKTLAQKSASSPSSRLTKISQLNN